MRFRTSPAFTFQNSASLYTAGIDVSGTGYVVDFESRQGDEKRFYPFRHCNIANNSDYPVIFDINNAGRTITVVNRATQDLDDLQLVSFAVRLATGSSEIGPNKIVITVWND